MELLRRIFGVKKQQERIQPPDSLSPEERQERLRRASSYLTNIGLEQTESIQQVMTSMDEIRLKNGSTHTLVNESLILTEKTRGNSQDRVKILERLQKAMEAIKTANTLLAELRTSFQTIHAKTRKINDIVSKTQLLSFNASIEAARAGQFGKGFSVVAEEVGRLAQSSGHAAKEIESLVSESEIKARSIVDEMHLKTDEGVNVARDVRDSFSEMIDGIVDIAETLAKISRAGSDQSVSIDRTMHIIERINQGIAKGNRGIEDIGRLTQAPINQAPSINVAQISQLLDSFSAPTESARKSRTEPARSTQGISADDPSFKPQDS